MSYEMLEVDGVKTNTTEGTEAVQEEATQQAEADAPEVATEEAKVEEGVQEEVASETTTDEPESGEVAELYWGDVPVEVQIPDEIQAAFTEKGIDAKAIVAELFAKDGKFELKEETRAKLDEAFGKPLVDGYLNLYKQQNELSIKDYMAKADAEKAQIEANATEFTTMVGGDDGWSELDSWAAEHLDEAELANINAVMSLPPEHWAAQKAVLQAIQIRREAALKEANGDVEVNLLGDSLAPAGGRTGGLPQTLTRAEFQDIMFSDKYREDREYAAKIDEIRRKSAEQGIA